MPVGAVTTGFFRTPILKAIIRALNRNPNIPLATRKAILERTKDFLMEVPQEAIDPIRAISVLSEASFRAAKQPQAGALYWPGERPAIWLREIKEDVPSSLLVLPSIMQHEVSHRLLDKLRQTSYAIWESAVRSGKGILRHGPEEPFTSELEHLSPGEFAERIAEYVPALKAPTASRVAKAIQRHRAKIGLAEE